MDIMLFEQVKNLYLNYLEIKPMHTYKEFTYVGGELNVTTRKNSRNNREIGERD